jgi:hypothetical protein
MFQDEFAASRLMKEDEYDTKSFLFKLAVRAARFAPPVL